MVAFWFLLLYFQSSNSGGVKWQVLGDCSWTSSIPDRLCAFDEFAHAGAWRIDELNMGKLTVNERVAGSGVSLRRGELLKKTLRLD